MSAVLAVAGVLPAASLRREMTRRGEFDRDVDRVLAIVADLPLPVDDLRGRRAAKKAAVSR